MEKMVTVEVLQKSQRTRPRKWIPVVCFIFAILTLALGLLQAVYVFPKIKIFADIAAKLPEREIHVGSLTKLSELMVYAIVPGAILLIDLFALIFTVKMSKYRHPYWWFGVPAIIVYIVMVLMTAFGILYYLVPFMTNLINKIPANILNRILLRVVRYGPVAMSAGFFIIMLFGIFYNVNYPGKYEEIYNLRKARIKSFTTTAERIAYRDRFYNDYKKGNWESMMLDLHYRAFIKDSYEPMRKDSYEFFVSYCCKRDATLKKAVFDQYAREGRFYECRSIYSAIAEKSDVIDRGGKVVLPHFIPDPAEPITMPLLKKKKVAPAPAPLPPRAPASMKTPPNKNLRTWRPEDI
ncbi:MAG: hypothetical protein IJ787_03140 [Bacilli bacterium]|nr:hypothetical protein [Bacilli bacterium]